MHTYAILFACLLFLSGGKFLLKKIDDLYSDVCGTDSDIYHFILGAFVGEPLRVCSSIVSIRETVLFCITNGIMRALWMLAAMVTYRKSRTLTIQKCEGLDARVGPRGQT